VSVPALSGTAAEGLRELRVTCWWDDRNAPPPLCIEAVRGFSQLHTLLIDGGEVSGLGPLEGCAQLRHLKIRSKGTHAKGLDSLGGIQACGQLESLGLSDCAAVSSIAPLSACTRLRKVDLTGCINVASVEPLVACAQLEELTLPGDGVPDGVAALEAALPALCVGRPWDDYPDHPDESQYGF
jgi:hypothetical protein